MSDTLDITPSPRVLRMLGQIDFAPWQCLAELIDNSIDAFIDQRRAGEPAVNPRIHISLPTASQLEQGSGTLSIADSASGMSLSTLHNAVKAGYSGNDPVEKMGLFGMGFNISTARLGRRTEVWTTTSDAAAWTGLIIDFDELERSKTFHAPIREQAKTENELEVPTHGTRILVSRLEPDRIRPLIWGAGKARTKRRLGKIYGRIMQELDITISYDGDAIKPWRHCSWNPNRTVPSADFGNVPARIDINETFAPRRYCQTCWIWLAEVDNVCSSCGHADNVIERTRTLRGWIGVQRYFDKDHFGIDLLRNGRVIEELDKSFFTFKDPSGDELFEYPRDAIHWGGRIVGELDIDFVRVSHQKDTFDKLDPEWKHVVAAVRGSSPLQPRIAERMGLSRNTSPLARLFSGYRKGIAGLRDLVPGDASGVGLNSGVVRDYVDRFYEGDAEYQDDTKWYELVLQAERANRGESTGAEVAAGDLPIGGEESGDQPEETDASLLVPATPVASPPERDLELSRGYEMNMLPGSPLIQVLAFRHEGRPTEAPYSIQPDGYRVRYDYYPMAPFFEDSLETPDDCLVTDLAQHFLALSAASPRDWPVSRIAYELRKKYFPRSLTNVNDTADVAEALLDELRSCYDEGLVAYAPIEADSLPSALLDQVRRRAFQAEGATEDQVAEAIRGGAFARYVANPFLIDLVSRWPTVCLDGSFFNLPYDTIAAELRSSALSNVIETLSDVRWLCEEASGVVSKDTSWRLQYARALASLRVALNWRA